MTGEVGECPVCLSILPILTPTRFQMLAEQLADNFTAKGHPNASTATSHDLNLLLTKTIKSIPID